jgi:hypothetical protein
MTCFCGHPYHEGVCLECLGGGTVTGEASERAPFVVRVQDGNGQIRYACSEFRNRWGAEAMVN